MIQTLIKLFIPKRNKPYVRALKTISYTGNTLSLWYGGADYYEYLNIDGRWHRKSSKKKVNSDKQVELDNLVASYKSTGRGRSKA